MFAHNRNNNGCTFVDLESLNWPVTKSILIVLELIIILVINIVLPRLCKDLIRSARMPIYLKMLIGSLMFCQWLSETTRLSQLIITNPERLKPWLSLYVYTFLLRELLSYLQSIIFTMIIGSLMAEIICISFRQNTQKIYFMALLCVLAIILCTALVVILNIFDFSLESMFTIKTSTLAGFFAIQFYIAARVQRVVKSPGYGKKSYLISMQRSYRRAVRGSRYMRLQLRISLYLFVGNSAASLSAYFWAMPKCKSNHLQIEVEIGELSNAILFLMTMFNFSHYMGGRIHRLVAKLLPSQKLNSTASTEPLYYNTEMLNPQEAHFKQLSEMWTTRSSSQGISHASMSA